MDGSKRCCNRQTCPHSMKPDEEQPPQEPEQQPAITGCQGPCGQKNEQPGTSGCQGPCGQKKEQPAKVEFTGPCGQPQQPAISGCQGPCGQKKEQPAKVDFTGPCGQPQQPAVSGCQGPSSQKKEQPAKVEFTGPCGQPQQPVKCGNQQSPCGQPKPKSGAQCSCGQQLGHPLVQICSLCGQVKPNPPPPQQQGRCQAQQQPAPVASPPPRVQQGCASQQQQPQPKPCNPPAPQPQPQQQGRCQAHQQTAPVASPPPKLQQGCAPQQQQPQPKPCDPPASQPKRHCASDKNSTQILFIEPNFKETPSEFDVFYDCYSEGDLPQEGSTIQQPIEDASVYMSVNEPSKSFKYPKNSSQRACDYGSETFPKEKKRSTAQCKSSSTNPRCRTAKPHCCTAQLEVTAKISTAVGSSKDHNPYRLVVDPITITVPIKVQFQQQRSLVTPSLKRCLSPLLESALEFQRSLNLQDSVPSAQPLKPQICESKQQEREIIMHKVPCVSEQPSNELHVQQIESQKPVCLQNISATVTAVTKTCVQPVVSVPQVCSEPSIISEEIENECIPNIVPDICPCVCPPEVVLSETLIAACPCEDAEERKYHLAYPQQIDLNLCSPCCYNPSPLVDDEGKVFCPGNCGCCLCPWKLRRTQEEDEQLIHEKIKICRCRKKGTIFTDFDIEDPCSNYSIFDVCPCREKAEAKYLELFGHEMWTANDMLDPSHRDIKVTIKECLQITPCRNNKE